jgi:hypothetical protein
MVHQGFLNAYDSVRPQVFSLLDTITSQQGDSFNPMDMMAPWKVLAQ